MKPNLKPMGFTLAEFLIGMALGLFIVCASLEFFVFAESLFFKLKDSEETGQGVLAALDKMRIDLLHAGQGLVPALGLGLIEAVEAAGDSLTIRRAGRAYVLADDAAAGEERLALNSIADLRPGRLICLWDEAKGEILEVASAESATKSVVLEAPLGGAYRREGASVILIETTVLAFDEGSGTLRRRVNQSSPQPLLDKVVSADFRYDPQRNLAVIRLQVPSQGGRAYEVSVFPKNPAAAR